MGAVVAFANHLDRLRDGIYASIDTMVMTTGRLLQEAFVSHPDEYAAWVINELPFGLDTARRLRAIYTAYNSLPVEILAELPKPWQALFAIRHAPQEELERGIATGAIGPSTTVTEAKAWGRQFSPHTRERPTVTTRSPADVLVGRLVTTPVASLSVDARVMLTEWLGSPPLREGAGPSDARERVTGV